METIVIDCNYLCYRTIFSMPPLSSEERDTHVIFGFFKTVVQLVEKFNTNKVVFCWDSKESFRKLIYKEYKINRSKKAKTGEELSTLLNMFEQVIYIRTKFLPSLGFKNNYHQIGMEADDLIATIVKGNNGKFLIITSDNDLLQLLNDRVRIYNPGTKKIIDETIFKHKYNINPNKWAEVKTLAGCNSDNIAGIMGVGETTAIKYLNGELKETTQAYTKIKSMQEEMKDTNKLLVTLPFHFTNKIKLEQDHLLRDNFHKILSDLQFVTYIKPSGWNKLIHIFNLRKK